MLELVTCSTDEQFTTTAAVKELLGIGAHVTSADQMIDRLISRASRWAESYIARGPLTVQSYRETLSGYGSRRLHLSRKPVSAVTGLWNATDTGSATTYLTSEYRVDHEVGFLDRDGGFAWDANAVPRQFAVPLAPSYMPGEEDAPWLCDYKAGYTYDGLTTDSANWSTEHGTTSTGRSLPEDIEDAVLYRVTEIYEGNEGIVERAVGDLKVKYATFSDARPGARSRALLDTYKEYA